MLFAWYYLITSSQSDASEGSDTESEFAADTEELVESSESDAGSEFGDSDASGDSGSESSFDDDESGMSRYTIIVVGTSAVS